MPTRLLLEGSDIESLLTRVRTEHGSTARIVSADKVRSGGVAGFFAKERFEVAVEVSDADGDPQTPGIPAPRALGAAAPAPAPRAMAQRQLPAGGATAFASAPAAGVADTPAASLADLAAMADRAEQTWQSTATSSAEPSASAARAPTPVTDARMTPAAAVKPPETPTPALVPFPTPAVARRVSTEGRDFAEMLAALTGQVAGAPTLAEVDQPPAEPESEPEPFTPAPFVPATPAPATPAPETPMPQPMSAPMAAVLDAAASGAIVPRAPKHALEPVATAGPTAANVPAAQSIPAAEGASEIVGGLLDQPAAQSSVPCGRSTTIEALIGLGLPEAWADQVREDDVYRCLVDALGALPIARAPRSRAGDVVVVVGDLTPALESATALAKRMRLDPDSICVTAVGATGKAVPDDRMISGPAEALRRARHMHRDDVAHIVVVDAPMDCDSPLWAREVADSFDASAVFAVIDATRKTADLHRYLAALGRIDGIDVRNTCASADPASVLALDAPHATVDGQPATAGSWAALLHGRLGASDSDSGPERSR